MTVRFDLSGANDRELPLILALMPVLSRAHTDAAHFEDQTLQIPVASGPYCVEEVTAGQRVVLRRDPNYWARDLPINRGLYNFDEIRIDYYRDASAMFEAFKAGLYDFRIEDDPTRWLTGYDFPAARDGRIVKAAIPYGLPKGMSGFAFNARRAIFADARVREALATMFDFEWINANLYDGVYTRSRSFFDDSELSSAGRPASALERALLAPFPARCATTSWRGGGRRRPPTGRDGTARWRAAPSAFSRKPAIALRGGALLNARGEPLAFEILVQTRQEERLALAFAQASPVSRRGARAPRRRSAISAPPHALRFRHDDRLLDRLALPGNDSEADGVRRRR